MSYTNATTDLPIDYKLSTASNTFSMPYNVTTNVTSPIYTTGLGTVTINTTDPSYLDYLKRIQAEMERQIGAIEKITKPELVDLKELLFG